MQKSSFSTVVLFNDRPVGHNLFVPLTSQVGGMNRKKTSSQPLAIPTKQNCGPKSPVIHGAQI